MVVSAIAATKASFDVLIINPSLGDELLRPWPRGIVVVRRKNEAIFRKYKLLQRVNRGFSPVFMCERRLATGCNAIVGDDAVIKGLSAGAATLGVPRVGPVVAA